MTLEELADLIRANSAKTNGRIDGVVENVRDLHALTGHVVEHVGGLHAHLDRAQNEANATLMNIQNDLTDVRGDIKDVRRDLTEVRQNLDLASTVAAMRRDIDSLVAEVAELKRRAS
jgi:cob(I)alamin adenosyltransferase